MKRPLPVLSALLLAGLALGLPSRGAGEAGLQGNRVFVVMSYHEEVEIERDIKDALDKRLAGAQLEYFWLDTKRRLEAGRERGREAFARYRGFGPDVVVAANDNAQELFVVPYLKDKVATPVVFCGVNNEAGKYGYPAGNVTGVLEIKHYRESIAFAQLIDPRIRKVGVVYHENLSNRSNLDQIRRERETYTAVLEDFVKVSTRDELVKAVADLNARNDALLVLDLSGVVDEGGRFVEERLLHELVARLSRDPTIGASEWEIEAGILCGVIKRDQEQGTLAAEMVRALLEGRKPGDLPITANSNGRRHLNLATLHRLGMTAPPEAIAGTKIIPVQE